jgi:CRISPR/Cas system CSM-associated protein Csm4 (group 5 of RAMP superfamily)
MRLYEQEIKEKVRLPFQQQQQQVDTVSNDNKKKKKKKKTHLSELSLPSV